MMSASFGDSHDMESPPKRTISIIYFRAGNYTVAKDILVNRYRAEASGLCETQNSHCQRITQLISLRKSNKSTAYQIKSGYQFCRPALPHNHIYIILI